MILSTKAGRFVTTSATVLIMVLFPATQVAAQDEDLQVGKAVDEWRFNVTPYVWMAGMDGNTTVKGFESEVDVGFDDIVDVLDMGFLGHFEATKGRLTIMSDLVYLKVSEDGDTPGPIISDIDVEMESLVLEVGGAYLAHETESGLFNKPTSLSLLGGLRYTKLDIDVDITATPAIADRDGSEDWIDPYIGFRTGIEWSPKWTTAFRADIGGFGIGSSSDFVYQLALIQRYTINQRLDFVFGYRHLDYDYDSGSGADKFGFDIAMSGPLVGMNIRF